MPYVTRATLPQEFYDITSARLLTQPEPQYPYARLLMAALGASLNIEEALGLEVGDRRFGDNGAQYKTDLDSLAISDGVYSTLVEVVPELGNAPGHTVRINRPSFTNSTYTEVSRTVPAGTQISTTPIAVSSEQVPLTLNRFAGPYDNATAAVAPYGVDRFDTSVIMHRPAQIVGLNMKRDFSRFLDAAVTARLQGASTIVRPTGMTTDNTPATPGDYPMSLQVLESVNTAMALAGIPFFPNGRRAIMMHPIQCQELTWDSQFNHLAEFHRDVNPLVSDSYWKSVGKWDIFQSATLVSVNNTPGGGGAAVPIYHAQALAPGALGVGVGNMPRVASSTADNYGEQALVIWLWYAALGLLDSRFVVSVRTS